VAAAEAKDVEGAVAQGAQGDHAAGRERHVGALGARGLCDEPGGNGRQRSARGTLTFNADGTFTYTAARQPTVGFNGADSFRFRASDGSDWSAPSDVTITITQLPPDVLPPPGTGQPGAPSEQPLSDFRWRGLNAWEIRLRWLSLVGMGGRPGPASGPAFAPPYSPDLLLTAPDPFGSFPSAWRPSIVRAVSIEGRLEKAGSRWISTHSRRCFLTVSP